MRAVSRFTQLAGTAAAVVLALNPLTGKAGLLDDVQARAGYIVDLSTELKRVTGNPDAAGAAGGFAVELESKLKNASDRPQVADYPKPVTASMLRITGVVTPTGLEDMPIKVCAEKDNKVLTLLNIDQRTGMVTPAQWEGSRVSASPTEAACKAFIGTYRNELNQIVAKRSQQPEQPRIVAATDGRTASNVAQPKPALLNLAQ